MRDLIALLHTVGFVAVELVGTTSMATSSFTIGALVRAHKRLAS